MKEDTKEPQIDTVELDWDQGLLEDLVMWDIEDRLIVCSRENAEWLDKELNTLARYRDKSRANGKKGGRPNRPQTNLSPSAQ
jgi:hypothetical protein